MRATLVLLLLTFAGFAAGCSSPAAPAVQTEEPCLVTSVDDKRCDEIASNATALGGGAAPHLHDYWGGQDRVVLDETTLETGGSLCTDVASVAVLRPADGQSIFQGTGTVEATLTWEIQQDPVMTVDTELWLKTAFENAAQPVGPAENAQTFVLQTDDDRNDLPHQQLSAWEFHLAMRSTSPIGCWQWDGVVTLHLELVRGNQTIPLYPGHPDRWHNATEIRLVEEVRPVFYYLGEESGMCLGGPTGGECLWTPHIPVDGAIVPYDAKRVVVSVQHAPGDALVTRLSYHGADTRDLEQPAPDVDGSGLREYILDVGDRGDGPYAKQSQWEFWLIPDHATEFYSGSYTVTITALKD